MQRLEQFGFSAGEEQKQSKGSAETKQKYEKNKRKRPFVQDWLSQFNWLRYDQDDDKMFCEPCRKYAPSSLPASTLSSSFIDGTNLYRVESIKSHAKSSYHIKFELKFHIETSKETFKTVFTGYKGDVCMEEGTRTACDDPMVVGAMDQVLRKMDKNEKEQLKVCINTAYWVTKQEMPFTVYPELLKLQEKNGVQLPSSYKSDMACSRCGIILHE